MSERSPTGQAANKLPVSDEQAYVRSQYRSKDNLEVRIQTHKLYSEIDVDFAAWVLDKISWRGNETVLDVGCGAGFYTDAASQRTSGYVAGDLSFGMLTELQKYDVPRVNLDAQTLPVGRLAADVILANHMLYHVPDIDRTLREFRRVLKPQGRLIAATNSEQNMAELGSLQRDVLGRLGIPVSGNLQANLTFTMENGAAFLSKYFKHVESHTLYDALVFPKAQPVIDYLGSSFDRYRGLLPEEITWKDIEETLHAILDQKIQRYGEFRVNKLSGVFVAWNQ